MKATELQIGDWVIFHDSGYASDGTTWEENRVCQIDSIDEDVRVKWYDESGCKEDWPHVSTMLLSPISLTPEILEKNGFVHFEEDEESFQDKDCVFIKQNLGGYGACLDKIRTISGMFHYVHELQHALRLCGITREIIL